MRKEAGAMQDTTDGLEGGTVFPDWRTVSPKQTDLNNALISRSKGKVRQLLKWLLDDEEVDQYHSWANVVSVRRLGYNDHGPVHARISTYNALKILRLLDAAGCKPSLVREEVGTLEDAQVAVALGCFLHDIGMGVAREAHEWHSIHLADDFVRSYLARLYPDGDAMRSVLRAMVHEIIVGHMAKVKIHSVEAGVVLVADGTDMSKGRSRVPEMLSTDPVVGDIHRYSANAIERVEIRAGDLKPVRITVRMANTSGLFQVEEVLMTKVKASPIMGELEVCAVVGDEEPRFYLK
jgi:metal-dependent HD superfamily phosphatase/phosphodiesterase